MSALVAVPVAALMFRLRGAYFAIGTWVMAEVFRLVASQVSVLGGGSGISLPAQVVIAMAPSRHARELEIYWLALALTVVVLASIVALLRSRHGLALTAIRDNEIAARSNGIDVTRVKFIVYVLTAFGTGLIGGLIFLMKLRISPDTAFSVNDWTAVVIFITVIGGIGRIEGPIIGTVIFFVMRQTLSDLGSVYLLIMGAVAILVMLFAPKGLWGAHRRALRLAGVAAAAAVGGGGGGEAVARMERSEIRGGIAAVNSGSSFRDAAKRRARNPGVARPELAALDSGFAAFRPRPGMTKKMWRTVRFQVRPGPEPLRRHARPCAGHPA